MVYSISFFESPVIIFEFGIGLIHVWGIESFEHFYLSLICKRSEWFIRFIDNFWNIFGESDNYIWIRNWCWLMSGVLNSSACFRLHLRYEFRWFIRFVDSFWNIFGEPDNYIWIRNWHWSIYRVLNFRPVFFCLSFAREMWVSMVYSIYRQFLERF